MGGHINRHTIRNYYEYGPATVDLFIFLNEEKNQSETGKIVESDTCVCFFYLRKGSFLNFTFRLKGKNCKMWGVGVTVGFCGLSVSCGIERCHNPAHLPSCHPVCGVTS